MSNQTIKVRTTTNATKNTAVPIQTILTARFSCVVVLGVMRNFDIKDGHRSVDPSGATFKNDHDAIERAKAVAIVVSIDKPEFDPTRYISVLNDVKFEIFRVPVYSKPTALW
jgi:hypothetical protein